jgi:signal transduction histidine kinase
LGAIKPDQLSVEAYADALREAKEELVFENKEKTKRAAELVIANIELAFQSAEKAKRAAELMIANKELIFQNEEKGKRAAELIIANIELAFQNQEKAKRAAELLIANKEHAFQSEEKEKRARELIVANMELLFQNSEKAKRAAELITANEELEFQSEEKGKRSDELTIANSELLFQNQEKERRAAELVTANTELAYQNNEKEKRANELMIANTELAYQNNEKEKRAAELVIANTELAYQNEEKGKRAAELIIANIELAYQNNEKEKRAVEMGLLNKELEQFAYIASHDLQQPLRTVSNYMRLFEEKYIPALDEDAGKYIQLANNAVKRMSSLINSLMTFSQLGNNRKLTTVPIEKILSEVISDHQTLIKSSGTSIEIEVMPVLNIYETEMYQLFQNLITNAIKFQTIGAQPKIIISALEKDTKWQFSVKDNGIGIQEIHYEKIFDIFQRLHSKKEYEGSGIGLANCKKIVQLHQGEIWLRSIPNEGTAFYFNIPKNLNL